MQSWLTHFAIVIEFEFTELWLLERGEGGITFRPFNPEESTFHQDFRWEEWHHCDGHYTDQSCSGSSKVLCNIHCAENDFVTREQYGSMLEIKWNMTTTSFTETANTWRIIFIATLTTIGQGMLIFQHSQNQWRLDGSSIVAGEL